MNYTLLSDITPQYDFSGYVKYIHLTGYPGDSIQTPGFGKVASTNTFCVPLNGSSSPYVQNKILSLDPPKVTKMEVPNLPETISKSQTGFGESSVVLESLNQS